MGKLSTRFSKVVLALAIFMSVNSVKADVNDFMLSLRNIVQTAPNVLEFDVYLLDTDASSDFKLSTQQLGIMFNSAIFAGGNITVTYNEELTDLGPYQVFGDPLQVDVNDASAFPTQAMIKLTGPMAQTSLSRSTTISKTGNGTHMIHFVMTSTVPFATNSTPNFIFNSSEVLPPLYATRVHRTIGPTADPAVIELPLIPGTNAVVDGNPVLNAYTGLAQSQIEAVSIYPNPMIDELNIELKGNTVLSTYEILNASGQLVAKGQFIEKTNVATKSFSPGVYVVKIVVGDNTNIHKLIKE